MQSIEKVETILQLQNISKIYPGTVALHNVSIEVRKGEVHGIIGKNGAGKSTLVGIIAGIVEPTEGEILIGPKRFKALSRILSKREKISIVPQEPQVILDLTVGENLFLADYVSRGFIVNWARMYTEAEKIIRKTGLRIDVHARAGDLSISEQQLLLVLKVCYVDKARIIILDEASASLSQNDEKVLYRIIEERKKEGNTIIFISHRTDELLEVCDRLTVIRDGQSITTRECRELNRESLSSLIVGEDFVSSMCNGIKGLERGERLLSVQNLTKAGIFRNVTFSLYQGEVLGLAGLRGSGRTEILKSIVGLENFDEGSITVSNMGPRPLTPHEAQKMGLVYLPEDREQEGLIRNLSVRENLVLNILKKISKHTVINKQQEDRCVDEIINNLDIVTASPEQEVNQLSGGNKQKVVIGRISAGEPKVLLLDEPTRGIDIAAKDSILRIIKKELSRHSGIILTSPGLDDLIKVCDRIMVLFKGEIIAEYRSGDFNENTLFLAMQGGRLQEADQC